MPPSIKLQAVLGTPVPGVDQEGGEPHDTHRTIGESDPADPELVNWLKADAGLGRTNGDNVNEVLRMLSASKFLNKPGIDLSAIGIPSGAGILHFVIRVMDGDGRV